MKIGDKVYCIRTRLNTDRKIYNNLTILTNGNYYTIIEIGDVFIKVSSDIEHNFIYRQKNSEIFYSFNDYFLTEKETRKQKLNKIYDAK